MYSPPAMVNWPPRRKSAKTRQVFFRGATERVVGTTLATWIVPTPKPLALILASLAPLAIRHKLLRPESSGHVRRVEREPDMIISIPAHATPRYLTGPHRYLAGPEVIANLRQIRGTDEPEVPERT
jgi:hypothetical protein